MVHLSRVKCVILIFVEQQAKEKLEKKVEELESSLVKHKTLQSNVADTLKVSCLPQPFLQPFTYGFIVPNTNTMGI